MNINILAVGLALFSTVLLIAINWYFGTKRQSEYGIFDNYDFSKELENLYDKGNEILEKYDESIEGLEDELVLAISIDKWNLEANKMLATYVPDEEFMFRTLGDRSENIRNSHIERLEKLRSIIACYKRRLEDEYG